MTSERIELDRIGMSNMIGELRTAWDQSNGDRRYLYADGRFLFEYKDGEGTSIIMVDSSDPELVFVQPSGHAWKVSELKIDMGEDVSEVTVGYGSKRPLTYQEKRLLQQCNGAFETFRVPDTLSTDPEPSDQFINGLQIPPDGYVIVRQLGIGENTLDNLGWLYNVKRNAFAIRSYAEVLSHNMVTLMMDMPLNERIGLLRYFEVQTQRLSEFWGVTTNRSDLCFSTSSTTWRLDPGNSEGSLPEYFAPRVPVMHGEHEYTGFDLCLTPLPWIGVLHISKGGWPSSGAYRKSVFSKLYDPPRVYSDTHIPVRGRWGFDEMIHSMNRFTYSDEYMYLKSVKRGDSMEHRWGEWKEIANQLIAFEDGGRNLDEAQRILDQISQGYRTTYIGPDYPDHLTSEQSSYNLSQLGARATYSYVGQPIVRTRRSRGGMANAMTYKVLRKSSELMLNSANGPTWLLKYPIRLAMAMFYYAISTRPNDELKNLLRVNG